MIDYLELLLEEQEREEPEETAETELSGPAPVRIRRGGGGTAASSAAPGEQEERSAIESAAEAAAAAAAVSAVPDGAGGYRLSGGIRTADGPVRADMLEASGPAGTVGRALGGGSAAAQNPWPDRAVRTAVGGGINAAPAAAEGGAGLSAAPGGAEGLGRAEGAGTGRAGVRTGGGEDAETPEAGFAGEEGTSAAELWKDLRPAWSGAPAGRSADGAAALYWQMVRAGQAAGALRQNAQVMTVTENAPPAPAPGAARLDEIFARDARRYDGGFSLY